MKVCRQVPSSLLTSSRFINSVKIRLDATSYLQTCCKLLKQLSPSLWIKSLDNQLPSSLLKQHASCKLYRLIIYWSTYFVTHESSYENNFSSASCRCGCANVFRGIIVEGDECCKANTSGFISQVPSHDCVEPVFTCFKNDVCTCFFHLNDDTLAITNKNTLER